MEILGLALLWPLLVLLIGFVLISSTNAAAWMLIFAVIGFFAVVIGLVSRPVAQPGAPLSEMEQLDRVRRGAVAFSIALLLPIFVKFMLDAASPAPASPVYGYGYQAASATSAQQLPTMILALAIGFGALVWGMFVKGNRTLTYANTVGGTLTIIYLYFQLWSLGQLAQVIATAFGLVVAIIISVVKFRDKLS